jgi:hypothetical protein
MEHSTDHRPWERTMATFVYFVDPLRLADDPGGVAHGRLSVGQVLPPGYGKENAEFPPLAGYIRLRRMLKLDGR